MLKFFIRLFWASFLFLMLPWTMQGQSFPYVVSVQTVQGLCYDDCHIIITLSDNSGHTVQIDPETHNAADSISYPLRNVQYYYQNITAGTSLQYSYDNDIIVTAGTYLVGVVANIPGANGVWTSVNVPYGNVQVTTQYNHLVATVLDLASITYSGPERCGMHPSLTCIDCGRLQLKLTDGRFPFHVVILNDQNDTVQDVIYTQRVQSGTNVNYANYRDYYTFDGMAAGNYSIFVSDACNYSISLTATIPDASPSSYVLYTQVVNECTGNPNTIFFAYDLRGGGILRDYMHPYLDSMVQYRFVNPGHDTTVWRHAQFQNPSGGWEYATDTLSLNSRFCDILGDTIEFQLYDLCLDSIFRAFWHVVSGFSLEDSVTTISPNATEIPDTCLIHVTGGTTTQSYLYYGADSGHFGWWIGSSGNYISTYQVCYSGCPLYFDVWSQIDSSLLAHAESNDYIGLGAPVSFAVDTTIPVHIAISDAYGCVLSEHDTVFTFQTTPATDRHYWWECGHFENNIHGWPTCCEYRYMWIQEHWVEADSFRRNMTLHLIESPLYNRFNFTAVRQNGVWTVTNDNPANTSTYVQFTYEDGWRATIRDSECLAPGRYVFEILTDCGLDTVTYQWDGYYTDSAFFPTPPRYEIHQVCDQLVIQPIDISVARNFYYIHPDIDNNVPEVQVRQNQNFYYTIAGLTNNVYFYVSAPASELTISTPGTYRLSITTNDGSAYCSRLIHHDTITFTPTFLDFDVADAYVCDVTSSFGSVMAQAIHGNKPYTYSLYDQWNATGNVIATNDTGFFNNVPMMAGQHLSVLVVDSCNNSFSVNLTASALTQENLIWSVGDSIHCEGDSIHLEAKQFAFPTSYRWTGPNGFSDTSRVIDVYIPYGSESGWYRVSITNSLCESTLSDSIYITVTPAPRVTILGDTIVCPDRQITLNFVPHGTGTVNFDIFHSDINDSIHYSIPADDTVQQEVQILSNIVFWADNIVDEACAYHSFIDSFPVLMRVLDYGPTHVYDTVLENDLPVHIHDTVFQDAGVYEIILPDLFGCDSVVFVHLTVLYNVTAEDNFTVCFSALPFTWNNTVFRADMMDTLAGSSVPIITQSSVLTASNGVDSTVTMTLYVRPTYSVTDTATICANELPYTWNGVTFTEAGTQYVTLPTVDNCDSMVAMTLIVKPLYSVTDTAAVCQNAFPHIWNGVTFTEAGTQSATLQTVGGCDSVVMMTLTVITTYSVTDTKTVCANELPYTWNGVTFTEAGTQSTTLPTVSSCDSVVTMTLIVKPLYSVTDTAVICANDLPHTWNEVTFTEAGTQSTTLQSMYGCDSVVAMTLMVNPTYSVNDTVTICADELPYSWNGVTFTEAGTQYVSLQTVDGCDSAVAMTLMVNPIYAVTDTAVICADELPYTWNGVTFTEAGNQNATLLTVHGCDSVVAMALMVNPTYSVTDTTVVCANELPYTWNGVVFTGAGTQSATLQTVNGCDSVVAMTLMVNPTYTINDTAVICADELPYIWNGVTFTEAGTQSITFPTVDGCDSVVAMTLIVNPLYSVADTAAICADELPHTWNGVTFTEAGTLSTTLQSVSGCDSVVAMTLMVNPLYSVTDTATVCANELPYTWNGVTFTGAGTQNATLQTVYGCDSVVAMTLLVNPTYSVSVTDTLCAIELPHAWNGVVFTGAGTQSATLQTVDGCDSVVAMTLVVLPMPEFYDTLHLVQNQMPYHFLPSDTILTLSSTFIQFQYIHPAEGCDSIFHQTIFVHLNTAQQVDTVVCAASLPISWHGHLFTGNAAFTDTLRTVFQSDSVVTYSLTVTNISADIGNVVHIVCFGDSTGTATATVSGGNAPLTLRWTNAANALVSSTVNLVGQPAGFYTFTVTDNLGCSASDTVTLRHLHATMAPGAVSEDQDLCEGNTPDPFLGTPASGGADGHYQWQINLNGTDWVAAPGTNNTQDYTYPDSATTSFSLRRAWISAACGTVFSNTVTINVWMNHHDTVEANVCQDELFQDFGFDIGATETGDVGLKTFTQFLPSSHCDSTLTLLLTVNPRYEVLIEDDICEGESYLSNGFSVNNQETMGVDGLTRELTLQSTSGCDSIVRLHLSVTDTSLHIESSTSDFCERLSTELMAVTQMTDYLWNTGETSQEITVTQPGLYTVTAYQGPCHRKATYQVENCNTDLYLPNTISPVYSSGLNDYFSIPEFFRQSIRHFEIRIYNRFGELVFHSTDKNFRWNGECNGQIYHNTIYNYIILYTDKLGKYQVKGSVLVL